LTACTPLRLARESAPDVPFIFLSGTIGEERAIEAIRMGATDYVLKSSMRRLGTAVKRALSETQERRAYEARIRHLANYDALSDVPNRSLLADRAAQAIAHARRTGRTCGLIVLNIDRFKLVNEGFGQAVGDGLLKLLAVRLRATVLDGDTSARLGADSSGLPIDCLKIDRSFVIQTTKGGRDAVIAQAIISLGHSLGLRVLAEGVEAPEQLEFLNRHGCNEYQGYLFSRPCAVDEVIGLLAKAMITASPHAFAYIKAGTKERKTSTAADS
jgi:predicted signal transduction protein with EAL and GGDEF domain